MWTPEAAVQEAMMAVVLMGCTCETLEGSVDTETHEVSVGHEDDCPVLRKLAAQDN